MVKGTWHKIYDTLKEDGLNPYPVGVHEGRATKPYVVVREAETIPHLYSPRLAKQVIELIVFVPVEQYAKMETQRLKVKKSMEKLDFLRRTGFESVNTTDPDRYGTSSIIEYEIIKRSDKHGKL